MMGIVLVIGKSLIVPNYDYTNVRFMPDVRSYIIGKLGFW